MKKAVLGLTLALAMTTAMGCATGDQGAVDDRNYRGAGTYQERGTENNQGTIGARDIRDQRGLMGRDQNFTAPRRGMFGAQGATDGRDNLFGRGDGERGNFTPGGGLLNGGTGTRNQTANDPGMLNRGNMRYGTDDHMQSRDLQQRILAIPGVRDCNVVSQGDDLVVGVETDQNGQDQQVLNRVRQECNRVANGQQVHITDDADLFNRIGDMDGRLQRGAVEDATRDFRGLLDDIGRTGNTRR